MLYPLLMRQFRTNDCNLLYHQLAYPVFSDTKFARKCPEGAKDVTSICHRLWMARAFPRASRSEAHETLSILFVRDGIPPTCICDNARELVQGKLNQKLKEAACHLTQLEPYPPWSNAAEREIKELKKGACCKLQKSRAPNHLWDYCLEVKAYIRSNTAHKIYKVEGKLPKTVMLGETSDQSVL